MSAEPIRMLHLVSSLNRRGAELSAVRLTDALPREHFSPALWAIAPGVPGAASTAIAPRQTPVLSPVMRVWPPAAYFRFRHLLGVLRAFRPHLVHCHGGRAFKYAAASMPFWRAGGYIYTKIGSIHPWLDHPARRMFYGRLFERLDAIVAVGEEMRRELEETFHPVRPRVVTIPTGIETGPFDAVTPADVAGARTAMGLTPGEIGLVAVGSLSWEKNPALLLRFVATLLGEGRSVRLAFVGGGPLEAQLRSEAERAGIAARVRFLGVREDVPLLLAAADIVAMPSVTEGLPAVLIEAGMAGRPVVAFRLGSVSEIVVDGLTGSIVPAGDETAFLSALRELMLSPELRRTMGAAARRRCRAEFSVERYVTRHADLFRELAGRRVAVAGTTMAAPPEGVSAGSPAAGEGVPR